MRCLPPPTDKNAQPFAASEVFENCVSMVRKSALRSRLQAVLPIVENEAADYDDKATRTQLYRKKPHANVKTVLGSEMVKVYTGRMVPKGSKGRPTYDRIMAAPVHGKCPLCGIGAVNTLDHYLPKTFFPVYSVTPINLVPACTWCQKEKGDYYPKTKAGQLLHPYYDDLNNEVWLVAEVLGSTPAGFRYFASPPDHWPPSAKDRVAAHLNKLNLPILFSSNAGSRLSEIRGRLVNLHQKGGYIAVRAHLREELTSLEADHKNSWTAAMYRAAVASHWFCDGGFM